MPLVLVTGATGFIASHTIADLLAHGYHVRGTVRSFAKAADHAALKALPGASERLELLEAQLLDPHGFDKAAEGCDAVLHMASPYVMDVTDPQKDLVDPAVQGTVNLLKSAAQAPSVKRVVVTSSMAAITDEPEADHLLTEADWNTKSSLTRNAYYYSKTMAERAAWSFMDEAKPAFDLVVINPFLVIGPSLTKALNTSNKVFADIVKGQYPAILALTWGFVDVRDVARAHVLALETPSASGRYICAADTVSMRDVVGILREALPSARKLPSFGLDHGFGTSLMRLAALTQPPGVGSYLRSHLGRVPRYDNKKIRTELGLTFRDVRKTIAETANDLVAWGHIKLR
ncbi:MAG: NAD-dependent epimerase/dehydratase family protein [Alphaproteobacteria bacterium]|jgi:dihydroflavonol-4-reductase